MVDRVTYKKHMDKGPWRVVTTPPPETGTYLESDDFTHDVRMKVQGDFATVADRELYALALAEALNEAANADATGAAPNGKETKR